jgi:hypothetical protein
VLLLELRFLGIIGAELQTEVIRPSDVRQNSTSRSREPKDLLQSAQRVGLTVTKYLLLVSIGFSPRLASPAV